MIFRWRLSVIPVLATLLFAAEQPWKDKQVAQWSEDDAKQVLDDSPWAKSVATEIKRPANSSRGGGMGRGGGGGMGRGGGMGGGGIGIGGIGIPGMGGGGGRRGGMGGGQGGGQDGGSRRSMGEPPTLTVRWESALPIQEAELKTKITNAPTIDEGHYGIAVYGIPTRMGASSDGKPKPEGTLTINGKKVKASSSQILPRDDGQVVVFLFP